MLLCFIGTKALAYDFMVGNIYYNYNPNNQSAVVTFGDVKYTGELIIPSSVQYNGRQLEVEEIGFKACYQCDGLSSVTLPNSIIKISNEAFRECKKMTNIKMSESLEEIGDYAFYKCTGTEQVDLPNSLKTIGWYAFFNTSIKSIKIPKTVSTINAMAYGNCSYLKTIVFEESNELVFLGSSTLGGGYGSVFNGVNPTALFLGRPIQVRNGNTDYNFADSLVTLTIGSYMKSKEEYDMLSDFLRFSFYIDRTKTIKTIYSMSENPMDISDWCFDNKVYLEAKLYVPTGTKNKYMSSNGWKNFFQIEEMDIDKMWQGEGDPNTEGIIDGMAQINARTVIVKAEGGQLTVEGAEDNTSITVYSIDGVQMGTTNSRNGIARIKTAISKESVAIVKIGNKSVKVKMK